MRVIDKEYMEHPFYGVRRMTEVIRKSGTMVNHKRIARLMRQMGIVAIHPKRNLSKANQEHKKYPYLLKDLAIVKPDQVWCSDITYIPMQRGFLYLVAVMDWFSRYVLSWRLSNTLSTDFCIEALNQAFGVSSPEIFNTDQGCQFTSSAFTGRLESAGIAISMDGKGRAFDNIFIERFWRSLKYEEVYLREYQTVIEAKTRIDTYINFYNRQRPHQSLEYLTPENLYLKEGGGKNPLVRNLGIYGDIVQARPPWGAHTEASLRSI